MDRFDVINFNDLTGPGGGEWVKIGGGSFGVVFSGEYLGTQVAIKEVLPNTTYDVEKYFERECVLMKEARHPNIVQYIGLTKSPGPDGRIYIISEFVGGNLRSYIADKRKPFPMRLRVSFATDISRALAYLHARNCMHRDLKGENLLITANERIKVCDFGFARIAARNEDEMRRISYCGTDGYMSPEILMGIDFSLPSDIFSLGVIFCELTSRKLVDSETYKRQMPGFGLDADEIRELASEGCPSRFIQLAIDCVDEDPSARPDMREIIKRLREIEQEVIQNEEKEAAYNVGSLRGSSINAVLGSKRKGGKENKATRPGGPPRLPSFNGEVKVGRSNHTPTRQGSEDSYTSGSSSDEMDEALAALEQVGITGDGDLLLQGTVKGSQGVPLDVSDQVAALTGTVKNGTFKVSGHGNPWWSEDDDDGLPSIRASWLGAAAGVNENNGKTNDLVVKNPSSNDSDYSTTVIRPSKVNNGHAKLSSTMSQLTNKASGENGNESTITVRANDNGSDSSSSPSPSTDVDEAQAAWSKSTLQKKKDSPLANQVAGSAPQSFMTAHSSHRIGGHGNDPSLAMATIASSIHQPTPLYHRFTLVKNGTKRPSSVSTVAREAANGAGAGLAAGSLLPPAVMLSNALAKCWVCGKRIGWKPFLDCDDCPYKTHAGCGEAAEPTCQEMSIPPPSKLAVNSTNAARRGSSANGSVSNNVSKHSSRATSPTRDAASAAAAALSLAQAADKAARSTSPPPDAKKDKKKDKKEKEREKAEKRKSSSPAPTK